MNSRIYRNHSPFSTNYSIPSDNETGLYNYDARLYDPVLGMFITPDSIVPQLFDPQLLNRFTYCRNNPLIYTDPSGHHLGGENGPQKETKDFQDPCSSAAQAGRAADERSGWLGKRGKEYNPPPERPVADYDQQKGPVVIDKATGTLNPDGTVTWSYDGWVHYEGAGSFPFSGFAPDNPPDISNVTNLVDMASRLGWASQEMTEFEFKVLLDIAGAALVALTAPASWPAWVGYGLGVLSNHSSDIFKN